MLLKCFSVLFGWDHCYHSIVHIFSHPTKHHLYPPSHPMSPISGHLQAQLRGHGRPSFSGAVGRPAAPGHAARLGFRWNVNGWWPQWMTWGYPENSCVSWGISSLFNHPFFGRYPVFRSYGWFWGLNFEPSEIGSLTSGTWCFNHQELGCYWFHHLRKGFNHGQVGIFIKFVIVVFACEYQGFCKFSHRTNPPYGVLTYKSAEYRTSPTKCRNLAPNMVFKAQKRF